MTPEALRAPLSALTAALAGLPLDEALDDWLNREHGAGSATYASTRTSRRVKWGVGC